MTQRKDGVPDGVVPPGDNQVAVVMADAGMLQLRANPVQPADASQPAADEYAKRAQMIGINAPGQPGPRTSAEFTVPDMGGMRAPVEVGTRRVDIAYVNPSAMVAMAYRGKGYYKERMELRVLASFPSWDRIAIVVSKELGVKSLRDIARRKIPLSVSTRFSGVNNATYYTISTILSLYGLSFEKIKRFGLRNGDARER